MTRLTEPEALELAAEALGHSRVSDANARIVATALVAAEMDGIPSHGLSRLPSYAYQAIAGKVNGFEQPAVSFPASALIHVDAHDGFAFPAIRAGLERIPERIAETGTVAVAIARSHHSGVVGHHVEAMAERGLVGLFFSNSPAAMAPWGGTEPTYGTNPIAFAAPTGSAPLVVDLGLARAARGKIMIAAQRGQPIPQGWAFDEDGNPTTDAASGLRGTLAPIGDAKGAALALMVEILAATLTGSNHAFEASSFFDDNGPPPRIGHLMLAIDPTRFAPNFLQRIGVLLGRVAGQPGVRTPGERRLALREKHRAEGFVADDAVLRALESRIARRG